MKRHLMRGHNRPPPDGPSVRTRWAKALFADRSTPAYVMAMAWVIHWYSDADGCGAAVSNEQFEAICGASRPTITRGKKWLLDNGYVTVRAGDGRGLKSMFRMTVPTVAKGETSDHLSSGKGETTDHLTTSKGETSEHLSARKGETSDQKGETSEPKGETCEPPILEYSGVNQEKGRASAHPPRSEIDQIHRMAMEAGHLIKGGSAAKSNRASVRTKGELDGSGGVLFENGKLSVHNGVHALLTRDFPGIDLQAVCDRAGPEITKLRWPTTEDAVACMRKWASYAVEQANRPRYGSSTPVPIPIKPPPPRKPLTKEEIEAREWMKSRGMDV